MELFIILQDIQKLQMTFKRLVK